MLEGRNEHLERELLAVFGPVELLRVHKQCDVGVHLLLYLVASGHHCVGCHFAEITSEIQFSLVSDFTDVVTRELERIRMEHPGSLFVFVERLTTSVPA